MPFCGFNPKMLKGLTAFAQGMYEQALKLADEQKMSLKDAMEKEIHEMNVFAAALDERYHELKDVMPVDEAMRELTVWAERRAKGQG
jgi:hypothetical protein